MSWSKLGSTQTGMCAGFAGKSPMAISKQAAGFPVTGASSVDVARVACEQTPKRP